MDFRSDIIKKYSDVKPNFMTFVGVVPALATSTISLTLDKSFDFLAEAITGFAFDPTDPSVTGYFTISQINLGNATNNIQGTGIHSMYFKQFSAFPIRFQELFPGGRDIQFYVKNESNFTNKINIIIQGKSLTGKLN